MIGKPQRPGELSRLEREVFGASPKVAEELAGLWREVFGQPPPVTDSAGLLCRVLVESLPKAPPYRPTAGPKPQKPAPVRRSR